MELGEYKSLEERESFYFWHVVRREILRENLLRYLGGKRDNKILDVGCGTGGNMLLLKEFGAVTGLDLFDEALKLAKDKNFAQLVKGDATKMPLPNDYFDIVSVLDTLEHVEDDKSVFKETFRVLKPGGILLVTVPVYQWLWSRHDEIMHHVRRYNKKDILEKCQKEGFNILKKSYFVTVAVIINLLRKLRDKIFVNRNKKSYDVIFPPLINKILIFILRCEKILIRFISLPFGTSIMIIAQKPRS